MKKYKKHEQKHEFVVFLMFSCLIKLINKALFNVCNEFFKQFININNFDEFCVNMMIFNVIIIVINNFQHYFFDQRKNA